MPDSNRPQPDPPGNRIWRVGTAEFDESRRELRVGGQVRMVEAKPLLLLETLLLRAGNVVTKEELLAIVWQGRSTVEQSLTTAMGKLREALGDEGRAIIEAVRGVGYRIGLPIELATAPEKPRLAFTFQPGDPVPNRPQWRLDHPLGSSAARDVWLARHEKTGEQRVFKFADTEDRRRALQREAALSRILHNALGDRPDLARITKWNFETRPAFLESPFGGESLPEWAASRGGLPEIPLSDRIAIVARIARTAATAHDVGVLHRDIKPSNVLLSSHDDKLSIKLVDFGSGRLTEAARLEAVTVTGLGLTAAAAHDGERLSGTLRYMAPEVLAGGAPTIAADVYALGILLYQMIVGDLDRPLGAGWEADVSDELLRDDITIAAASDASRRLSSAAILADRLEGLDARKVRHEQRLRQEAVARCLAQRAERAKLRRPWLVLTAASLVLGIIAAGIFAFRATGARDDALREAAAVRAIDQFMTEDLLGRGNPSVSGDPKETVTQAALAAEPMIERRFAATPKISASIYLVLATVFDTRFEFDAARQAYRRAYDNLVKGEGPGGPDVLILSLRQAIMERNSLQAGSFERSRQIVGRVAPLVEQLTTRRVEVQAWLLFARAQLDMTLGNLVQGQNGYAQASDIVNRLSDRFDDHVRFDVREHAANALVRLYRWPEAKIQLGKLFDDEVAQRGPNHPDTLKVALDLALLASYDGDTNEAIARFNQLYPILRETYGPASRQAITALTQRGVVLAATGRFDEAVSDDMEAYNQSKSAAGPDAFFTFSSLGLAGEAQCRAGHTSEGLPKLLEYQTRSGRVFGENNEMTTSVHPSLALCYAREGHADQAEQMLDGIDCKKVGDVTMTPQLCANLNVIRGAIFIAEGKLDEARRILDSAISQLGAKPFDPFFKQWGVDLLAGLPSHKH